MRCIEVWIDDERVCTAGDDQMESLQASLFLSPAIPSPHFTVSSLVARSERSKESLRWTEQWIEPGQTIRLQVVDDVQPDAATTVTSYGARLHPTGEEHLHCSFCGIGQDEAEKMIRGAAGNACGPCIEIMHQELNDET